jgi:hypothetical protein
MAFPIKQLFASFHLRIFRVVGLEPGSSFPLRDVGSEGMFGNDTFKIHSAHTLEQRCTVLLQRDRRIAFWMSEPWTKDA